MRELRQRKSNKREAKFQKIIDLARQQGRITNDEIQKLLRVSDATAARYAHELVIRGLLKKVGRGRISHYQI
jgi:Fic family protein